MTTHDANQPDPSDPAFDPALDRLARRLDALGLAEADAAPPGLERRVLDGVGRVFTPEPIPVARRDAGVVRWFPRLAVAAGLALFAGASALLYTGMRRPAEVSADLTLAALAERRIEGLLALSTPSADGFRDKVASIELWADALSAESGLFGSDLIEAEWLDAGWAWEGAL